MKNFIRLLTFIIFCASCNLFSQQLAFPEAEGYGRHTSGGRGGIVYKVTNLNDDGEGSLRKGIVKHEPRIIVFEVSGTIELQSPLDINHGNLTIAGQSAPGEGITIKGYPVSVKDNNVIIRYIRFRMGDVQGVEGDAFKGRGNENIIIDHCSVSWATDENASFYWNKNFTMQWCIISEALNRSVHHKGAHGYGGIWGGQKASFHHNLLASNNSRNPRFSGSSSTANSEEEFVDFRNNVIFNWGSNSIYGGEGGTYNMINNYFKPGPATSSSKNERIVEPYEPYGKFYVNGNIMEGSKRISNNNWSGGVQCDDPEKARLMNPVSIEGNVETQGAEEAYELVLKKAGSSLQRDEVDSRIVESIRTGTLAYKEGIIDSQEDVGGWPKLESGKAEADNDDDGMPDTWEKKHGLDPNKPDDKGHQLDKAYTNIEVYLNSLTSRISYSTTINGSEYHFVVASDGSGDYSTVQEVINAIPDFRKKETKVYIKNGVYKEKLVLPASKTNVTFVGEDKEKTILTYDDYAQKLNDFGEEMGTTGSTSFFVFADNFRAQNITFQNSAGPVGQAVAVRVDGDKVVFENCKFLGNQDTLYLHGRNSRQYYKNCYIEGTVDFIFGWSTAVFEDCEIFCKDHGYITAASTEKESEYGMVFLNCKIKSNAEQNSFYLGRPWRDYAQTVFIDCYMDNHIKPEGWHNWNKPKAEKTTFYAEYNSSGPGASNKRVNWAKKLSKKEAEKYTVENVMGGEDGWNPQN